VDEIDGMDTMDRVGTRANYMAVRVYYASKAGNEEGIGGRHIVSQ
jgi:hypothetical protein